MKDRRRGLSSREDALLDTLLVVGLTIAAAILIAALGMQI